MTTEKKVPAEYRPFPDEEGRNARQSRLQVPALVRALRIPTEARVLEVGCGRGIALPVIDRLCRPSAWSASISTRACWRRRPRSWARSGADGRAYRGDVREMPFADDAFDVVIDFGTLFHIARPEAAAAEIMRVLAPGGLFIEETKLSQLLRIRSAPAAVACRACGDTVRRRRSAGLWSSRSLAS